MQSARPLVRQTPVHHQLVEGGALLKDVAGWLVAEHFGDAEAEARAVRSGVGLCDLSAAEKWEIKGNELPRHLAAVFGPDIPAPGYVVANRKGILCRVSRHHALFLANRDELAAESPCKESSSATCAHATNRTSGLASFLLCGPKARDVLGKLTSLDLRETRFPNHRCRCGPMAAIQVVLVHKDRGQLLGYEILVSREYGEYLWKAVTAAGEEYHLRHFGMAALRLLEQ